ncbi:MAG: hypothetical protein LCH43_14605 [Actinobacteria bacterium]|nr:hypothetical protein [Actinomycetota bacterium]
MQFEFTMTDAGSMLTGSSPDRLATLLEQLQSALDASGAPTQLFRHGQSERLTIEKFDRAGLAPLDELIVWFGWHDGEEQNANTHALPAGRMATSTNALLLEARAEEPGPLDWGAPRGWLPLVEHNAGLAADCTVGTTQAAQLRNRAPEFYDEPFPYGRAVSLCTPVAWWLYALDSGALVWDQENGRWGGDARKSHPSQIEAMFF